MTFSILRHILSDHRIGSIFTASIAAVILFLGTYYSVSLGERLLYADEGEYLSIGRNVAEKGVYSLDGLHPTAYRPPGYPLVLALFIAAGFDIVQLRIVNVLFLLCAMYLLQMLLRRHVSSAAGMIGSVVFLCYPVYLYTAGTLYPQTFGMMLLILFITIVFFREKVSVLRGAAAGAVAGIMLLTIPACIVALLTAFYFLMVRWKRPAAAAVMLLTAAAVMSPWIIRNYAAFDRFIPFSTNSGINLLIGNSPGTTPNAGVNVDLGPYVSAVQGKNEAEKDEYYRIEAVRYITEHPAEAAWLYLRKTVHYFHFRNDLATAAEGSVARDVLMALTYLPLLLLGIFRIGWRKKYQFTDMELLFITIYLASALFHAIFFTRIRFRLPFDLLLIGIAASLLSHWFHRAVGSKIPAVDRSPER